MTNIPNINHLLSIGRTVLAESIPYDSEKGNPNPTRPRYRLTVYDGDGFATLRESNGNTIAFHTPEEAITFRRLCLEKLDRYTQRRNSSTHVHGRKGRPNKINS